MAAWGAHIGIRALSTARKLWKHGMVPILLVHSVPVDAYNLCCHQYLSNAVAMST